MIGEQFDHGDEICAAVVNVRSRERISIWTKNASNESAQVNLFHFFSIYLFSIAFVTNFFFKWIVCEGHVRIFFDICNKRVMEGSLYGQLNHPNNQQCNMPIGYEMGRVISITCESQFPRFIFYSMSSD